MDAAGILQGLSFLALFYAFFHVLRVIRAERRERRAAFSESDLDLWYEELVRRIVAARASESHGVNVNAIYKELGKAKVDGGWTRCVKEIVASLPVDLRQEQRPHLKVLDGGKRRP